MSEYRLASDTEAELDDIWLRIARESGSIDLATRIVERIIERFGLLARYSIDSDDVVLILHVVHGNRDVISMFGH